MAASSIPTAAALLLLFFFLDPSESAGIAPGPTAAPLNLTGVLEKGGQYNTFLRLLKATQVGQQLESQLNNSFNGITVFAPTDNAFNGLKPGTLNSLTAQEQVSLVLYHVLPRYYSPSLFETTSNPVNTQASGSSGVYTVNITSTSNQVNLSTGINEAPVNNNLYLDFPLAVYSIDKVLLPYALFGAKPPASAAPPAVAPPKPKKGAPAEVDAPTASADQTASAAAASFEGMRRVMAAFVGITMLCMGSLL